MARIVLHIGMERTGSGALQRFFARHRAALRVMGVRYPRGEGEAREKHQDLVTGVAEDRAEAVIAAHAAGAARAPVTVLFSERLLATLPVLGEIREEVSCMVIVFSLVCFAPE